MVEYKTGKRHIKTTEKEAGGIAFLAVAAVIVSGAYKFGNAFDDYLDTLKMPSWPDINWPDINMPDIHLPDIVVNPTWLEDTFTPDAEARHTAEMKAGFYGGTVWSGLPLATEDFKAAYPEHPTFIDISGLEVIQPMPTPEIDHIAEELGLVTPPTESDFGLVQDINGNWMLPENLDTESRTQWINDNFIGVAVNPTSSGTTSSNWSEWF